MSNFECCKTKSFPNSYFICVNCIKIYHRSCVLKDKTKVTFVNGYKIKCCKTLDSAEIIMQQKSILEDTITEMNESTLLREQHINKLKQDHEKFIEEITEREEELNMLIGKQEEYLQKANEEIEKLRRDIILLQKKPATSTNSTQTMTNKFIHSYSQTDLCLKINQSIQEKIEFIKADRRNLLLVAGHHGRGIALFLSRFLENFAISSLVKPNATSYEILQTAVSSSKNFTKNDFVIVWPDEKSAYIYEHMSMHLNHTNYLMLTTPNRFDYPNMNQKIYQNNLSLFKKTHGMRGNLDGVIDVNNILKRTNYGLGGYYIRSTGKRYIAAHLVNLIKQREHQQTATEINICTNMSTCNAEETSEITQLGTGEIDPYIQVSEPSRSLAEEMGIHNTFLYPRLSQVAPLV